MIGSPLAETGRRRDKAVRIRKNYFHNQQFSQ